MIDYTVGDTAVAIRTIAPAGVDIVVEVSPAVNAELDLAIVAPRAVIAIYADNGGGDLVLPIRRTFSLNLRYQFILLYTVGTEALNFAKIDVSVAAAAGALSVDDGVVLGLKGLAAALVGGLGSLRGALVGGLVLGVLEALAVASPALGAAWTDVLPLGVLVAVLAVRPAGLLVRHREPVT